MTRRPWIALFVVAAVAAVVVALGPCRGEPEPRRIAPASDVPDAKSAATPIVPARRHAAVPDDEKKPPETSPAPPAKPAGATIVVHVVAKETGGPLVGAEVVVEDDAQARTHGATDAAGLARFEGVVSGPVRACAGAAGFVRSDYEQSERATGDEVRFEIALERGAALDGVVLDARNGRPIAGAAVEVRQGDANGYGSPGPSGRRLGSLVASADGRFRLHVPAGEPVTADASAAGFVAARRTTVVAPGDARRPPLELRLDVSGVLRGTVRAPDGSPAAGAVVEAHPAGDAYADPLTSVVDAAGRYEIDGFARGGAYVVFAKQHGSARSTVREGVLVTEAAPEVVADFTLRRRGVLVLRVLDPDGASATAARVEIESGDGPQRDFFARETDEMGVARFDDLDPGEYQVAARTPHAPPARTSSWVAEGETSEVVVRTQRGAAIAGFVVDDRGAPVIGAEIDVRDPRHESAFLGEWLAEPPDGRFRIDGLDPRTYVLHAHGNSHSLSDRREVTAPAEDVKLVAPRSAIVTFRIATPPGTSPPESVWLEYERTSTGPAVPGEPWRGGVAGVNAHAMNDGLYDFSTSATGPSRVRVGADGFAPAVMAFDVAPGATVDVGDVRLDPGVDWTGRVVDAAGAPVAGARVRQDICVPRDFVVSTDAVGSFRLRRLAPGRLKLAIDAANFVSIDVEAVVAADAPPLVVRLARGALLHVSVADAAGAPVFSSIVESRAPDAAPTSWTYDRALTDHRGVAEMRLPAGRRRITIEGREGATDVDLVEGGETSVRLVVK